MQKEEIATALADAKQKLNGMPKIDIKGKQYATVASRVEVFREHFPSATIETLLIHDDSERVVIQARISIGDTLISTGYSEEFRGEGWINATSALENSETSAIGRSLAAFGLSGTEYSSADELDNAIAQQHRQVNQVQSKSLPLPQPQSPQYAYTPRDYQSLYSLGLQVAEQGNNLIVTGENQFAHKDSIRACGFRWDSQRKIWWQSSQRAA
jgi:hypothetical protein